MYEWAVGHNVMTLAARLYTLHNNIMATTLQITFFIIAFICLWNIIYYHYAQIQFGDKLFVIKFCIHRVGCYLRGKKALSWRDEARGNSMLVGLEATDSGVELDEADMLDSVMEIVGKELKVVRRKPRRNMRMPYVYYLVNHCRGELGQLDFTTANIKWVERTARAHAHERLVRSADLARILPHVVSMYFSSRDGSQSLAARESQSSAFVLSVRATHARSGASGAGAVVAVG